MTNETMILIAAAISAGVVGYVIGRLQPRRSDRREIHGLKMQLAEEKDQAEAAHVSVDEHFEKSATLFGQLAQDYRALFEHFTDSASKLGVSEAKAQSIIEGARVRLVQDERTIDSGDAETSHAEGGGAGAGGANDGEGATLDDSSAAREMDAPNRAIVREVEFPAPENTSEDGTATAPADDVQPEKIK